MTYHKDTEDIFTVGKKKKKVFVSSIFCASSKPQEELFIFSPTNIFFFKDDMNKKNCKPFQSQLHNFEQK